MNYLAHFHLSYGDPDLQLGALLGDFIKGPLTGKYPQAIEQGIILHRKIDAYTDRHQSLQQLHRQFQPQFRRFAGIMTDVVFDHLLALHWQQFHHQSLAQFSAEVYQLLSDDHDMPAAARRQADVLINYDVFAKYQHWGAVEGTLLRISQRMKRDNPLTIATEELEQHFTQVEQVFLRFYPELQQETDKVRSRLSSL